MKIKVGYFGEEEVGIESKRNPNDLYFFISLYPSGDIDNPMCIILDNDGVSYHPQQSDSSCWFSFESLREAYYNGVNYSINRVNGNKYVCCDKRHFSLIMNSILNNNFTNIICNTKRIIFEDQEKIATNNNYFVPNYNESIDAKIRNNKPILYKNPNFGDLTLFEANYTCELCNTKETFLKDDNKMYFEAHHLIYCNFEIQKQFTKKLDNIANMYCLCANCHRKMHFIQQNKLQENLHILFDKRKQVYQEIYKIKESDLVNIYRQYRK